jgi:hypothetical protein
MTKVYTSSAKLPADTQQTGSWQNQTFVVTKGTKLSVDSKLVEILAAATWLYIGGQSAPGVPLPPVPDSATLNPSNTILTDNSSNILRLGDKATGSVDSGNYIEVENGQTKLRSDLH